MESVEEEASNGVEYKNSPGNRSGTISLESFKLVATSALEEHDELRKMYEEQQIRLQRAEARLRETEEHLVRLTSVSQQACEEMVNLHDDLEMKIDVEQRCREEAESYATQMVKENKKIIRENKEIKRKSMALLGKAGKDFQVFDISLDDIPDEGESAILDESEETSTTEQRILIEELQYQVKDLTNRLTQTQNDFEKVRQEKEKALERASYHKEEATKAIHELALENTSHQVTKDALKEQRKTLEKLNRVSTLVIQEYQDVSTKYEEESVLRETAEQFAAKMYSEKQASDEARRKSLLMLDEVVDDTERITQLLDNVKQLNETIGNERQSHKKEIEELQERLASSEDLSKQESLTAKLQLVTEEISAAERRIYEFEQDNKKLRREVADLKEAAKPAPPPAPPPPPPPAPAKNPLRILKTMINSNRAADGSRTKSGKKSDPARDQHQATMEEMMNRIKRGEVRLRPVGQSASRPKEKAQSTKGMQAVQELDNILQSIKKSQNGKFTAIPPDQSGRSDKKLSEFDRIMEVRRQKSSAAQNGKPEVVKKQPSPLSSSSSNEQPPSTEQHPPSSRKRLPSKEKPEDGSEDKKVPVPTPRISTVPPNTNSMVYQEVQPAVSQPSVPLPPIPSPRRENANAATGSMLYDTIPEAAKEEGSKGNDSQVPDPDDPSSLYALVNS